VPDELTGPDPEWCGAELIDRFPIGMAGHFVGGTSTIDGTLDSPPIRAGTSTRGHRRELGSAITSDYIRAFRDPHPTPPHPHREPRSLTRAPSARYPRVAFIG